MFRGNEPARINEKWRLKVPNAFRTLIESTYGRELYLTSLNGDYVRIYPMPVWQEIEKKLAQAPSMDPAVERFVDCTSYYGKVAELDAQGRVLIPLRLRDAVTMSRDVDVLGKIKYLDVWNHDRFLSKLQNKPYTDDNARALSELGI